MSNTRRAQQQPAAGPVKPHPVPMNFTLQRVKFDDADEFLELSMHSPTGTFVAYLGLQGVAALAVQLAQAGQQMEAAARSGLVVAPAMAGLSRMSSGPTITART